MLSVPSAIAANKGAQGRGLGLVVTGKRATHSTAGKNMAKNPSGEVHAEVTFPTIS